VSPGRCRDSGRNFRLKTALTQYPYRMNRRPRSPYRRACAGAGARAREREK
jgi:hypothetical protein